MLDILIFCNKEGLDELDKHIDLFRTCTFQTDWIKSYKIFENELKISYQDDTDIIFKIAEKLKRHISKIPGDPKNFFGFLFYRKLVFFLDNDSKCILRDYKGRIRFKWTINLCSEGSFGILVAMIVTDVELNEDDVEIIIKI